jgi:hypothetical protein
MDLTQYAERVRNELLVAAQAGGDDARALAERLSAPLDSAIRLTLLDALSAAADEITREIAPASVEVRLRGGEPEFAVTPAPAAAENVGDAPRGAPFAAAFDADDGTVVRINLRLPEQLKVAVEKAAGGERLSVNAWLVRVVAAALGHDDRDRRNRQRGGIGIGDAFTGWVR